MNTIHIVSIIISLALFTVVIDFIRRGLLKEKYSVLWLALISAVMVLSVWKGLLDRIAGLVGVAYPPSLLFLVAFLFVILILLHFSVVISVLTERNKALTQEVALLKEAVMEVEKGARPGRGKDNN
ncbi:MAG: DUF2304 domain-containing protein [Deltaproteobacteria bacterium]|nr:DUF2304 domain-containing protein [Deltaproteobacteria bacterium]